MASKEFQYQTVVRENLLDAFGHVNNAAYLVLYEEARWEFISQNGYGLKKIQETQQGPVVLEIRQLQFRKELNAREPITIHSKLMSVKGKIMEMHQEIRKGGGELASEMVLVIGFFDLKNRRLIPFTPEWLKACGLEGETF